VLDHHLEEPDGVVVDRPLEAVTDVEHLTGELAGQGASRSVVTGHCPSPPSIVSTTRSTLPSQLSISATVGASS
jgi:hypothetical protein